MSVSDYFKKALEAAKNSPDTSRKTGCVLVLDCGDEVGAWNDFPAGVTVTDQRLSRPAKYVYTEHAERNAIYAAARLGQATLGATMYLPWYPCADCARALVQAGVKTLHCVEPNWSEERYGFRDAESILAEGGVVVQYHQIQGANS
jgi:dCMP deaminase